MFRVLIHNYSSFYDLAQRVEFTSVLDRRTNCHVGVAEVTAEQAAHYAARPHSFSVLTDAEWAAMTTPPVKPTPPVPQKPDTGDPLTDQAAAVAANAAALRGSGDALPLDKLPYAELQKLAVARGIKSVGVGKNALIEALQAPAADPVNAGGPPPPPPSK